MCVSYMYVCVKIWGRVPVFFLVVGSCLFSIRYAKNQEASNNLICLFLFPKIYGLYYGPASFPSFVLVFVSLCASQPVNNTMMDSDHLFSFSLFSFFTFPFFLSSGFASPFPSHTPPIGISLTALHLGSAPR